MPQYTVKEVIWKTVIFTFCLLQPRTRDQSECTDVSDSKTQFLAKRNLIEINTGLSYLYDDLQTVLRFNKNKQTINDQLQSQAQIGEHFDLRTLRE